jgi:hypothetical protein
VRARRGYYARANRGANAPSDPGSGALQGAPQGNARP